MAPVLLTFACGITAGMFHHQLGIAPILGAILCAACFLSPRALWGVGLGGILIQDLLIGFSPFTVVRLMGMAAVVALVQALKVKLSWRSLAAGLLLVSPVFHLALVAGDWWTGTCAAVPRTASGLWAALAASLPYFLRSTAGDFIFATLFLGAYTMAGYLLLGKPALSKGAG